MGTTGSVRHLRCAGNEDDCEACGRLVHMAPGDLRIRSRLHLSPNPGIPVQALWKTAYEAAGMVRLGYRGRVSAAERYPGKASKPSLCFKLLRLWTRWRDSGSGTRNARRGHQDLSAL
ncbi:hypothetical protein GCM10023166_02100 [Paeniglutamicibacter cryotolerans]